MTWTAQNSPTIARHPRATTRPDRAARPDLPERIRLEGRDGPAEIRTHPLGFKQAWPRPSAEDLRAFYADGFYDSEYPAYLSQMERDRPFWDATWSLRRTLLEAALPSSRRRILDIGASGGFLLDHFRQHGWEVDGIEPSRAAVRWAKEKLDIEIFCGELLDYPHPKTADPLSGSAAQRPLFDAIHCSQVFEHVLDPVACIARVADLLAPGGVAFIEVPNDFNAFQEAARADLDKPAWWVAPRVHLNYFDAESLGATLRAHGLEEEDRLASFPMELFLLMGEDYVGHPEQGSACHAKRMRFEETLFAQGASDTLLQFYRALGKASLGRTIGLLARKSE
jgi:2-polyprenyl-3-methyl-5-hydroxy-6-metoxy-1,4-benzoquinol methylase